MFRTLICPSSGARDYTYVIAAYGVQCLGCWWSAVRSTAADHASGMREIVSHNFSHPRLIACCSTPNSRPPTTKALHTICGNNTSIVSSSWWWTYECPKHVEQILSAIKHSVASSWFSFLPYTTMHGRTYIKFIFVLLTCVTCTSCNLNLFSLFFLIITIFSSFRDRWNLKLVNRVWFSCWPSCSECSGDNVSFYPEDSGGGLSLAVKWVEHTAEPSYTL